MSEYGRLYERVGQIRVRLKEFRRITKATTRSQTVTSWTDNPLILTDRLSEARASVKILKSELDAMLSEWEQLEKEMETADDR